MFGLPNQTSEQWADSLDQALALGLEHLSLYSLIVEPNTPLNHWIPFRYHTATRRRQGSGPLSIEVCNGETR